MMLSDVVGFAASVIPAQAGIQWMRGRITNTIQGIESPSGFLPAQERQIVTPPFANLCSSLSINRMRQCSQLFDQDTGGSLR